MKVSGGRTGLSQKVEKRASGGASWSLAKRPASYMKYLKL